MRRSSVVGLVLGGAWSAGCAGTGATSADFVVPTPMKDGARFTATVTHPYFPLATARYAELSSGDEKVIREVLGERRTIAGVECVVLVEKEHEDGELAEITRNFFAQDAEGNVWYFGEEVDDYADGKVVGHGGAWLVGRNATEPCLFMPAQPRPGFRFKPENSPPAAEEWDEIADIDARLRVPAGSYDDVVVIREGSRPDALDETKYYGRGVGLLSENRKLNLDVVRRDGEP